MIPAWNLLFLPLGVVVGVVAGLFGIGGGVVMVPVMTTLFLSHGFDADRALHLALGSSMAIIIPTAISALREHQRQRGVLWIVVLRLAPAVVIGSLLAPLFATALPPLALAIFFILFISVVALQLLLQIKPQGSHPLPGHWGMSGAGLVIGVISSLVAIGGGTLTVPFLIRCRVDLRRAIATSAAVGVVIASAGTVGYISAGWAVTDAEALTLGYLYIPAVILTAVTSVLTAPWGARLAHSLPLLALRRLFAALLLLLGLKMLYTLSVV
ncbi:MAG: sulfite exporter TauE/SafE family protein [Gammaproteobacteria bacterium]|nr:sulfite exporter TauE/SafE family protein [Gammaproteobacteria bacterium]